MTRSTAETATISSAITILRSERHYRRHLGQPSHRRRDRRCVSGHDTLRSIELVRGTQFDDTYTAAGYGAPGALNVSDTGTFNQFEGMGGNDTITGNGNTRVDYNFALASVTVDLQAGTGHSTVADDAGVGNDTILTGVNSVRGSSFNDFLFGSANNENFLGVTATIGSTGAAVSTAPFITVRPTTR